jgi:outer membrane receptor protein involved in Fe transport
LESWKAHFDIRRRPSRGLFQQQLCVRPHGGLTFAYEAFLESIPDSTSITEATTPDSNACTTHYAFFIQDDWRVTPHLTVNYGLRWEYHRPFGDTFNNQAIFLPDAYNVVNGVVVHGSVVVPDAFLPQVNALSAASIAPTPIYGASQIGIPESLHTADTTSFAPRIGLAWRPFGNDKTVVRGGFGRYIEPVLGTLASAGFGVPAGYTGAIYEFCNQRNVCSHHAIPVPFKPGTTRCPGFRIDDAGSLP